MTLNEWLEDRGISGYRICKDLSISTSHMYRFLRGECGFGSEVTMKIYEYTDREVELESLLWVNGQKKARRRDR